MRTDKLNEHVSAGQRLWCSKLIVHHFDKEQMCALVAEIEQLVEHGSDIAVCIHLNKKTNPHLSWLKTDEGQSLMCALQLHFTDIKSCRLILNGMGIRASTAGQLGGGVSVCLRSLIGLGWGDSLNFARTIGKALWGRYVPASIVHVAVAASLSIILCSKWYEVMPGKWDETQARTPA